jgi:hypothetical protein
MSTELGWITTPCESANSCIEVLPPQIHVNTVAIRSALAPHDVLRVTREEWVAFVSAVKDGVFNEV